MCGLLPSGFDFRRATTVRKKSDLMSARKNGPAETASVKYVYLDIVGFTRDRSVEAQSDLVAALNKIVKVSLRRLRIPLSEAIFLPTGDGMAIALMHRDAFDIHLRLAISILQGVAQHNESCSDWMREFEVRIGVNENVDNVVIDINGKRNVAGYGVSMAQRIMDKADGGQILVGDAVFERLKPRESYMKCFRSYRATAKHGTQFHVHQYIDSEVEHLNLQIPSVFDESQKMISVKKPKMSEFLAHYIGQASIARDFLKSRKDDVFRDDAGVILLTFLARDAIKTQQTPSHEKPFLRTWQAGTSLLSEQYKYYLKQDSAVISDFAECIANDLLASHEALFAGQGFFRTYWLAETTASDAVREQHPDIFQLYPSLASVPN